MREPLDLNVLRQATCRICHNRGWYPDHGGVSPCDCAAGEAVRAVEKARARLSTVYDSRAIDLWLQSRIAALGGERPINLLREGHAQKVLAAIERIPGIPPQDAAVQEVPPPEQKPPEKPPENPESVRRVLCTQLRRFGENRIATALERGNLEELTEREQALLDAAMTGTGYLVGGDRVAPEDVEVVHWGSR